MSSVWNGAIGSHQVLCESPAGSSRRSRLLHQFNLGDRGRRDVLRRTMGIGHSQGRSCMDPAFNLSLDPRGAGSVPCVPESNPPTFLQPEEDRGCHDGGYARNQHL
jgi:hypothetical protein